MMRPSLAVGIGIALLVGLGANPGVPAAAAPQPAAQPPPKAAATGLQIELTAPTGPHPVGVAQLHLTDSARADPLMPTRTRELMVSVWYPAGRVDGLSRAPYLRPAPARLLAEALLRPIGADPARLDLATLSTHAYVNAPVNRRGGRFPAVLYSPGGSLVRALGTTLVEDLASRGYVVIAIDHTHEAPVVEFPDGRLVRGAPTAGPDGLQRMLETRVADARFVLDELERLRRGGKDASGARLPTGLAQAMDLSRAGMFGHSAGGFASLEAASQDRRLDAVANLDGSLAYSMSRQLYGPVVEKGLDRPFMLIGAGVSGPEKAPHTHAFAPEWKRLWERSTGWKRDFHLAGAEHMAFADHVVVLPQIARQLNLPAPMVASSLGADDPARTLSAQRTYVAAFFDQHLKRRPQKILDEGSPQHPGVERVR